MRMTLVSLEPKPFESTNCLKTACLGSSNKKAKSRDGYRSLRTNYSVPPATTDNMSNILLDARTDQSHACRFFSAMVQSYYTIYNRVVCRSFLKIWNIFENLKSIVVVGSNHDHEASIALFPNHRALYQAVRRASKPPIRAFNSPLACVCWRMSCIFCSQSTACSYRYAWCDCCSKLLSSRKLGGVGCSQSCWFDHEPPKKCSNRSWAQREGKEEEEEEEEKAKKVIPPRLSMGAAESFCGDS